MAALNYNHLRYFHAVAHAGSLTRAAAQLNLSQSALSVQLKSLEAALGHDLFDRGPRRMALTEAGKIALDYADTVFAAGDALQQTLAGRVRIDQQVLRIGALPTLSRNFQAEFIAPLIGRRDVELVMLSGTMRDLVAQLEAHELDVVLANQTPHGSIAPDILCRRIAQQPVGLVAPPGLLRRPLAFPQDLAKLPVLLPTRGTDIRTGFDQLLDAAGIQPIILAEVDDMAMLRLLARGSDALTLVPPIVVKDELAAGSLEAVFTIPGLTEDFHAITQRRRFPNPLLAELIR
ncbi:MAG: LysR family transcriptional regulator [Alphaproteobacteria bacterium]|nr:LysR family transcriptional regulator [Alphaproteobacteria bacterium]